MRHQSVPLATLVDLPRSSISHISTGASPGRPSYVCQDASTSTSRLPTKDEGSMPGPCSGQAGFKSSTGGPYRDRQRHLTCLNGTTLSDVK